MRADRARAELCASARVFVDHRGLGAVEHLVAVAPHPLAPVHVLEVQEVALIHQPHVAHRAFPGEHGRPQDPIHRARVGVVPIGHEMVPEGAAQVGVRPERRPSQQEGLPIVEAPGGKLKRSVRVQELGSQNARPGMLVRAALERFDGAGPDQNVGVQDENPVLLGRPDTFIHPARVAQVPPGGDHPGRPGQVPYQILDRLGRVVHDEKLPERRRTALAERPDQPFQGRARVIVDDHEGQGHGGSPRGRRAGRGCGASTPSMRLPTRSAATSWTPPHAGPRRGLEFPGSGTLFSTPCS